MILHRMICINLSTKLCSHGVSVMLKAVKCCLQMSVAALAQHHALPLQTGAPIMAFPHSAASHPHLQAAHLSSAMPGTVTVMPHPHHPGLQIAVSHAHTALQNAVMMQAQAQAAQPHVVAINAAGEYTIQTLQNLMLKGRLEFTSSLLLSSV